MPLEPRPRGIPKLCPLCGDGPWDDEVLDIHLDAMHDPRFESDGLVHFSAYRIADDPHPCKAKMTYGKFTIGCLLMKGHKEPHQWLRKETR